MFSPQKYKLPGSSEDTLTGPGDPWQLCSDSICGCALHLPRNLKTDPSANGVKRLPVTGRGGVTQYKNTGLMALNIFFLLNFSFGFRTWLFAGVPHGLYEVSESPSLQPSMTITSSRRHALLLQG